MDRLDRIQGCLLGGAAGDALGYAVEFMSEEAIAAAYGAQGIAAYEIHRGLARISDDTQMTLFTACGLLYGNTNGIPYIHAINEAYLDWLATQSKAYEQLVGPRRCAWLRNDPRLHSPRAPGNTCLSALLSGGNGTTSAPINHSKGCGGVMRVAPIGSYLAGRCPIETADRLGAEAAALTHGHPLGWLPAAMLVHVIFRLTEGMGLTDAVADAATAMGQLYPEEKDLEILLALTVRAAELACSDVEDLEAIHILGEGWVAEEALAIALYCALKYPADFDRAMVAAVNHRGDSDSTGAITGNILGAALGLPGIPEKYRKDLELADVILELGSDLYRDGPGADPHERNEKYGTCAYCPGK